MQYKKSRTIDEYIASYPKEIQHLLQELRQAIREAAPKTEEGISYGMPVFKFHGNLVYFGAFKNHISLFPTSSGVTAFTKELKPFKHLKGAIQFPLDKPLPLGLIKRIVKFRLKENEKKEGSASRRRVRS